MNIISECGDKLVFGNSCEINPNEDFVFDIRLDLFDEKYKNNNTRVTADEMRGHYKNTKNYMYNYLYTCSRKDKDCRDAWSNVFDDKMSLFESFMDEIVDESSYYIKKLGKEKYDKLLDFNLTSYDFCSIDDSIKEKCIKIAYKDECAIETSEQLYLISNKLKNIYREFCFASDKERNNFIQQLYDHKGKSIYKGKLSNLGKYWSWKKDTKSFWGRTYIKEDDYCVVLEGRIDDSDSLNINDTYAVNQSFNCREGEIRLSNDSNIKIIDIEISS